MLRLVQPVELPDTSPPTLQEACGDPATERGAVNEAEPGGFVRRGV